MENLKDKAKRYQDLALQKMLIELEMFDLWYDKKSIIINTKLSEMETKIENLQQPKPKKPLSWWLLLLANIVQSILSQI